MIQSARLRRSDQLLRKVFIGPHRARSMLDYLLLFALRRQCRAGHRSARSGALEQAIALACLIVAGASSGVWGEPPVVDMWPGTAGPAGTAASIGSWP